MPTKWWFVPFVLVVGCGQADEDIPLVTSSGTAPQTSMPSLPGVTRNLAYGDDPKQVLDLFVPAREKGEPLVVFVHGGAWQGGSRSEYEPFSRELQEKGIAAATIDYRLSPAVKHPAHAEDAAHALAWLVAHAGQYGYDSKRVFVVGHSAGGHIAGTIATDPKLLALASPAGFVGLEGIYDVPNLAQRWPTYPNWFLNNAFGSDPSAWPAASPTRAKVVSHAPWLVAHSKGDELVDMPQTDGFVAHLRAAGVAVEVLHPEGETHFAVVGNLARPNDAVAEAIVAFVNRGKSF